MSKISIKLEGDILLRWYLKTNSKFALRKEIVLVKIRKILGLEYVCSCFRNAMCLIHFLACVLSACFVFLFFASG